MLPLLTANSLPIASSQVFTHNEDTIVQVDSILMEAARTRTSDVIATASMVGYGQTMSAPASEEAYLSTKASEAAHRASPL